VRARGCCGTLGAQGAPAVRRPSACKPGQPLLSHPHMPAFWLVGLWRSALRPRGAPGWRQMWRASADEDCDSEDGSAPGGAAPGGEGASEGPAAAAPPAEACTDRAAAHGSAGPSGRAAAGGGGGGGAREPGGRAGAGVPGAVPHLMAAAGDEWPRPPPEGAAEVAAAELSARLAGSSYGAFDEDVRAMAAREVSGLGLGHARTRSQSQGGSPSASGASSPAASFHGGLDAGGGGPGSPRGGAALRRSGSMNLPLPEDSGVPATHPDMCIMRCRRNHLVQARARAGARACEPPGPAPRRLPAGRPCARCHRFCLLLCIGDVRPSCRPPTRPSFRRGLPLQFSSGRRLPP